MISKKEVQTTPKKGVHHRNLKFMVFSLIQQGQSPAGICKKLNLKMSALSYYLRVLKASKSIEKVGYGVWKAINYGPIEVQKQAPGRSQAFKKPHKEVRGHAFQFTLKIPRISNWLRREDFLKKKEIKFDLINNGHVQKIDFRGHKVWLCSKSIVVYTPEGLSYFAESGKDSKSMAVYDFLNLIKGIENMLGVSLRIRKEYVFKVSKQHYALINNELAKQYNDEKKKLYIYNKDGLWFAIDDSFNLSEAECLHPRTAEDDLDRAIKPFFNTLKEAPFTAYDFKNLYEIVQYVAKHDQEYAENIKLHLGVLKEIKEAIRELRRENNGNK